jgi:hypothetical protein
VAWTADHRGSTPPKSFFESLPRELEEAAQIDGLGWFGIFVRIVLPLSKAVLATMILFYAVSYWNDWFTAFLYLDNNNLFPLSLFLRNLIAGASTTTAESAAAVGTTSAIIPILFIYPFVQRHFVSGVMLAPSRGNRRRGQPCGSPSLAFVRSIAATAGCYFDTVFERSSCGGPEGLRPRGHDRPLHAAWSGRAGGNDALPGRNGGPDRREVVCHRLARPDQDRR